MSFWHLNEKGIRVFLFGSGDPIAADSGSDPAPKLTRAPHVTVPLSQP